MWLHSAMFNIYIMVSHIQGTNKNVTDLLSRWSLTPKNIDKMHKYIKDPVWMQAHVSLL